MHFAVVVGRIQNAVAVFFRAAVYSQLVYLGEFVDKVLFAAVAQVRYEGQFEFVFAAHIMLHSVPMIRLR